MKILKFIWYCIECMLKFFASGFGNPLKNFTWKEGMVGALTFIVISLVVFVILLATGVIKFKKKSDKDKEDK